MTAVVLRGDAAHLPLPDACVDLVVTSPPYFGLRSYTDGCPTCAAAARHENRGYMERYCPGCGRVFTSGRNKCHKCDLTTLATEKTKAAQKSAGCPDCGGNGQRHYDGQIGSEATPAEYVAALAACTAEWVRVLKPSGSIFVNLGDKYNSAAGNQNGLSGTLDNSAAYVVGRARAGRGISFGDVRPKSLIGLPWRYALACMDDLGLILRRDIIWSKPNGLPESVTDRCRSSHEYVFHFTVRPRYYAAVDEIREPHDVASQAHARRYAERGYGGRNQDRGDKGASIFVGNPLGKLPGSVWDIPSQPLTVPAHLGVDHFAAFPMELPRRCILGWSPPGICTGCGEGRRPVASSVRMLDGEPRDDLPAWADPSAPRRTPNGVGHWRFRTDRQHLGYACACPLPDAPVRPAVVLDPFGGTGTTALVAAAYGRVGVSVDRSADYCRLARWRTADPAERAKAMMVAKPPPVPDGQSSLFDMEAS